ncbi:unnamed protein product [Rotaria sp. Silwood1]|nr:unnamed protein product [Rotaria sp. Silwood1]CAF1136475.1 unnamed protein product [Rotaria sp. Silwood1]CAF3447004.1 unnamed protein product [Rotaria sp. Silwood1]
MAYNPNPPMTISSVPMFNPSNMNNNPFMHLLTQTSSSVSSKLSIGGVLYIITGLVSIGLDIGALTNRMLSNTPHPATTSSPSNTGQKNDVTTRYWGPIAGKELIVQITIIGDDLGESHFDLQMPSGGVDIFDGCSSQFPKVS